MKKLLFTFFVLGLCGSAGAGLVTQTFEGEVSSYAFYMGTGYSPQLFSIGDTFTGSITYDDVTNALVNVQYQIDNLGMGGGNQFNFTSDGSGYITYVRPTDFFAYGIAMAYTSNWAVTTDGMGGFNFSHNMNMAPAGQPANQYCYNFNAVAVPEPATVGLLSLGGLLLLRRRR